jgi:hypothetical protein
MSGSLFVILVTGLMLLVGFTELTDKFSDGI